MIADTSDKATDGMLLAPACSPSLTPETDAAWDCDHPLYRRSDKEKRELASKLERERDELAGYLCRIKLPLPVRFVADLATLFPGKNTRMKDVEGYLCIFRENV